MFDMPYKNDEYHHHRHDLSFRGLLPYTAAGVGGVALIEIFQSTGYPRKFLSEFALRFLSGTSDSLWGDGIYLAVNIRRYLKQHERRRVVYYSAGRVAGALLSWLPHLILANTTFDMYSSYAAIIPVSYAQLDLIGGCVGVLMYYTRESGVKKGFEEFIRDPMIQVSLALFLASLGLDGFVRMHIKPDNYWIDFLETWILSFSCLVTTLVGAKSENKKPLL